MIERLGLNKVDVAVGLSTGLTYAAIAPSNEAAAVIAPIVAVATPYVGKGVYALYRRRWHLIHALQKTSEKIQYLTSERIDSGPDGYYGLKSDHAKGGIQQVNLLEEEGFETPESAEKKRQLYARRHRGQ